VKHTGQESWGELCKISKFWSFLQSKRVNNVRKLIHLLRNFLPRPIVSIHWCPRCLDTPIVGRVVSWHPQSLPLLFKLHELWSVDFTGKLLKLLPPDIRFQGQNALRTMNSETILPRDAMLVRYMLSSCVCLSVRLSVCHKSEFYTKMAKPSHKQRHTITHDPCFLTPKSRRNSNEITPTGCQMEVG